jgi:hypothetical protein
MFKRKKKEEPKVEEEIIEKSLPEPIEEDVLDLGWYWSENKKSGRWQRSGMRIGRYTFMLSVLLDWEIKVSRVSDKAGYR